MENVVVVYKSKYGHTQKYAEWIAEELNADLIEASKAKVDKLLEYDIIVYGGGLFASGIHGVRSCITKNYERLKNKNLVVFTVGLASTDDLSVFEPIKKHNFTDPMITKIRFFHLRGGINYKKLTFVHKAMMAMLKKMVEKKEVKTEDDKQILKTYGVSIDFSNKDTIKPLVAYVKSINKELSNA